MSTSDRRSYDTGASAQAQGNLASVIGHLESVLALRDSQVKAAMSNFQADGVSDQYQGVEHRWNTAAAEVRQIITLVRTTLQRNDDSATTALSKAGSAVAGIG